MLGPVPLSTWTDQLKTKHVLRIKLWGPLCGPNMVICILFIASWWVSDSSEGQAPTWCGAGGGAWCNFGAQAPPHNKHSKRRSWEFNDSRFFSLLGNNNFDPFQNIPNANSSQFNDWSGVVITVSNTCYPLRIFTHTHTFSC